MNLQEDIKQAWQAIYSCGSTRPADNFYGGQRALDQLGSALSPAGLCYHLEGPLLFNTLRLLLVCYALLYEHIIKLILQHSV